MEKQEAQQGVGERLGIRKRRSITYIALDKQGKELANGSAVDQEAKEEQKCDYLLPANYKLNEFTRRRGVG